MNLKKFRELTANMPDHIELYVVSPSGEHYYGLVQSVSIKCLTGNSDEDNDDDYEGDNDVVYCLIIEEE